MDLSQMTLNDFKKRLVEGYLPPSMMILKDDIDTQLGALKKVGITNAQELKQRLKTRSHVAKLAKETKLSERYLTILRREINGYESKTRNLRDFTWIDKKVIKKLETLGLKNTLLLFGEITTPQKRSVLSKKASIPIQDIEELARYVDLCRIRWVGPQFARLLYEAGYDTVKKVTRAEYQKLHAKLENINSKENYYNAKIGLNDMKILVEIAKDVPQDTIF